MIDLELVRRALRERLLSVSGVDPEQVAWQNRSFVPTSDVTYIRETFLPGEERQAASDQLMAVGLVQFDIFAPVNDSTEDVGALAHQVKHAFRPKQNLEAGTLVVNLVRAWIQTGVPVSEDRYMVPVIVSWRTFAPLT